MVRKQRRRLTPEQRVEIAKDLFEGVGLKRVCHNWDISINTALKIRGTYITYIRVWRTDCRYFPKCTYPRCNCGIKHDPERTA